MKDLVPLRPVHPDAHVHARSGHKLHSDTVYRQVSVPEHHSATAHLGRQTLTIGHDAAT